MKNQILDLEKAYWTGMANHDYEAVKSLTKFPCIVASNKGVMNVDEPSYQQIFEQGADKKLSVENISNEQITLGADHAMIAYQIDLNYDGKKSTCICTSTWIKEDDKWRCAMHTETPVSS